MVNHEALRVIIDRTKNTSRIKHVYLIIQQNNINHYNILVTNCFCVISDRFTIKILAATIILSLFLHFFNNYRYDYQQFMKYIKVCLDVKGIWLNI